ncbi:MAG: UvrD-helicase domain-containing protein [Firmicutes bacterium]|nr:UvrD-helicase domain-containing protein [Bacillota bacterium]
MNLDLLNKEQKEAVEFMDGPLLVIAGAGSGKTKVLTTRIANLVEKGVDPTNILAITFTNKAAKEMKERVINILGPVAYETTISTFHSFGLRILKVNYALLGYDKNFTILDSDDVLTIIKKILKDMNLDPKKYNPKAIRNKISSCKNELIDSKGFLKYVNTDFDDITQKVFSKYEEKLKQNSSVDFDDLLILPIILFRSHPDVLRNYQELYKYILIDEYQDTNEAQYILVKMISAKYKNICVVGDESQSIYSFRGSNYRNILNFEKDYKDAKVILLERNYRSTKKILDVANSIIKNNKERKDKKLWTDNESGDNTVYHRALDEKDEAKYVTEKIEKLIDDGVSKKDIAVLYRTNAQSRNIEEALLHDNVPYKVVGSFYFYNRKEIKDLISYLKLIYNHKDDISLSRIINVPKRGIGPKTIENLNLKASSLGTSIFEVIDSGKELEFKKLIEEIEKESEHLSLTELVDFVLEKSGMKEELVSEKSLEADIRLENLEEFKSITKSFEENHGIVSLEDFLEEISLVSDIEEHKKNDDVVTLMTVHSSKGLEFEYVFLIGMEESIFPHINSFDSASAIEEERRLCYVAVTRAKKKLWIINAKKRILYGNDVSNIPSRFINEIDENLLDVDKEEKNSFIKSNILNKKVVSNEEYNVGDRVMHDVFGQGVIITVDKSLITVAFPHPHGIKKLMKGHSSIRKV